MKKSHPDNKNRLHLPHKLELEIPVEIETRKAETHMVQQQRWRWGIVVSHVEVAEDVVDVREVVVQKLVIRRCRVASSRAKVLPKKLIAPHP
jgi:hypothetical protein